MASRQNAVGGGAPASAGPQVRQARPMRPAARGRYDDDDERPRRRRFEDEEDEKPRRRRADVSDDEDDYRPKKKPVKKATAMRTVLNSFQIPHNGDRNRNQDQLLMALKWPM